jgi:hypothetical protein
MTTLLDDITKEMKEKSFVNVIQDSNNDGIFISQMHFLNYNLF